MGVPLAVAGGLAPPSGRWAALRNAGTYLVSWNGHGDALALHSQNGDGTLTLANSFTYSTWGRAV